MIDNDFDPREDVLSYKDELKQQYFLGTVPYGTILEKITAQFTDYIGSDDSTNWVEVFYNIIDASYSALKADDSEEYPVEIKESLDEVFDEFIQLIVKLFETRLAISIEDMLLSGVEHEDSRFIVARLYEYFILSARLNFKTVAEVVINDRIPKDTPGDQYFEFVQNMISEFGDIINGITPEQFIQYTGDKDIFDIFNSGNVTGNFLRRYSPRLYDNEEFMISMINYITSARHFNSAGAPILPGDESGTSDVGTQVDAILGVDEER